MACNDLLIQRQEQFVRLFVPMQPQLYGFIRSMVFNRADCDELLQEAITVAWRRFDTFEPGTRFDQWLYRIAFNQVRYFYQKQSRDFLRFSDTTLDLVSQTAWSAVNKSGGHLEALESCLDKLPDADRDIVRRRQGHGVTNRSLAGELGMSESKISRTLNRIYTVLMLCVKRTLRNSSDPLILDGGAS